MSQREALISQLRTDTLIPDQDLLLSLPQVTLRITSNRTEILEGLSDYFRYLVTDRNTEATTLEIEVYQAPTLKLELPWTDWRRESDKSGRKDSFYDIDAQTRLLFKVRTGMLFCQSNTDRIAAGPCLDNMNQVINYVNNQYMNLIHRQGWMICHAAALSKGPNTIAFAGMSGGGKSTTMLKVLDTPDTRFMSNDRLFIKANSSNGLDVRGIPKLPRINPGTILHNPVLKPMLSQQEVTYYSAMPQTELWGVEHKFDVDIETLYGKGRISMEGQLQAFVVLRWHPENDAPTSIERVDITDRPELLKAIMKAAGPFYQDEQGHFSPNLQSLDPAPYLALMSGKVPVIDVSGGVDFDKVCQYCLEHFLT